MAGSTFGTIFQISTWGESHGDGIGVVVDGVPAGLPLSEEDIQYDLDRRKPGQSRFTTPRKEADTVRILSGVFEGKTTGTPVSMLVFNETQRSRDYSAIANCYRPGHADFTYDAKYGFRDYRGGGRSSGRETIGRVAAGAIARKILRTLGVTVDAYTLSIGDVSVRPDCFQMDERFHNALYMPDAEAATRAEALLAQKMEEKDSVGGVIECRVEGLPAGVGDPVFDKLDACLAKAIMSIGAVKGVEIGDGIRAASSFGSQNNDGFFNNEGVVQKTTNHAGGILGGISDGSSLLIRAAFKPTPSIFREQQTVTSDGTDTTIAIRGRHDPVIVPRAVVVVEAMTAVTLVDLLFTGMSAQMDRIAEFYQK